jgi:4-aminobutyrate aminotransferase / (S)-3-amino-2-methylpropionate transaminase / 5-aminovalerate transaminase
MTRRFAHVQTALPGPRSRALQERERRALAPGIQSISLLAGLALDHGEGALLVDVDGNRFIDFVAGICVASLGHGHPALKEALAEQAGKLTSGSFTTEVRTRLLERIAEQASKIGSGALRRTQLYSGGSEAVESALRLARAYTKKHEVLAFWGGFHGKTGGVVGLLGSDFKHGLGPSIQVPGQFLAPYPDPQRSTMTSAQCIEFVRQMIKVQTTGQLAAIIVEPIQGTNGNVIPPADFLPALKQLAREHKALLILDEMITGWGRTGRMFGQMHFDVEADIMTFGKGVAAGFPVTGLVTTDEIADPTKCDPWGRPSFSSSSYGGSPLGAAAADASTRVIVEEKLDARAASIGEVMLGELRRMQVKYPFIADARGKGLLLAIDLIDVRTGQPLDKPSCEWIFRQCLERGLLTMSYAPRVRINPPLVITEEQAKEGLAILDEVLGEFARRPEGHA